jgi:hypothetical protein
LRETPYLTGWTNSLDFPGVSPGRVSRGDPSEVFVVKLNSIGSQLLYADSRGRSRHRAGHRGGFRRQAPVAGSAASADFPTSSGVQASAGGPRLLQSTDAGVHWSGASKGLNSSDLRVVATDRTSPVLYTGGNRGVSVSRDGGASWTGTSLTSAITLLAIDPRTPSTVYAAAGWNANLRYSYFAGSGIFRARTADLERHQHGSDKPGHSCACHDPETPSTLTAPPARISSDIDSGQNWTAIGPNGRFFAMAIDH